MKRCTGCNGIIWPWQRYNKHVEPSHNKCWKAYIKGGEDMNKLIRLLKELERNNL